jgi:hypothetical protein
MKALFCIIFFISSVMAQDSVGYLKNFDSSIYSLKSKGVSNFIVDIESSKLTKDMNDQQIFGKIDELTFRVYWTLNPERLAIEVNGLPDGFREIKESLKLSILEQIDNLLPKTTAQNYVGYKFIQGSVPKEIIAQDTTGLAPIPSFSLKFDQQDKLTEVVGNRPIGTFVMRPIYTKEEFSDGKLVLKELISQSQENGQSLTIRKELEYGKFQGIGVLVGVTVTTEQKIEGSKTAPIKVSDSLEFKNYKINDGEALKYFLSISAEKGPSPKSSKK